MPNGSVDTFTYTLTDGDGDTTTQTLTITFTGDANSPTVNQPDRHDRRHVHGDDGAPGSRTLTVIRGAESTPARFAFNFGLDDGPHAPPTPFDRRAMTADWERRRSRRPWASTHPSRRRPGRLTIDEVTGAYTFTQTAAYAHGPRAPPPMAASFDTSRSPTTSDGATAVPHVLTLDIDDDEPTAAADVIR